MRHNLTSIIDNHLTNYILEEALDESLKNLNDLSELKAYREHLKTGLVKIFKESIKENYDYGVLESKVVNMLLEAGASTTLAANSNKRNIDSFDYMQYKEREKEAAAANTPSKAPAHKGPIKGNVIAILKDGRKGYVDYDKSPEGYNMVYVNGIGEVNSKEIKAYVDASKVTQKVSPEKFAQRLPEYLKIVKPEAAKYVSQLTQDFLNRVSQKFPTSSAAYRNFYQIATQLQQSLMKVISNYNPKQAETYQANYLGDMLNKPYQQAVGFNNYEGTKTDYVNSYRANLAK